MAWFSSVMAWVKALPPTLALTVITFLPALELRASIPYGIFFLKDSCPLAVVLSVCVTANILLGVAVFFLLDKFVHIFRRWGTFARVYNAYVVRTQRRIQKPVERWGELGVAVFIGVPLPGSGVYSGALAAYILGLSYRKFFIANVIGVLIAATAVTLACLLAPEAAGWLYKSYQSVQ